MHCYCLCVITHPEEKGVCTGKEERRLIFRRNSNSSENVLSTEVPMCNPCAEATLLQRDLIKTGRNHGSRL